MKILLIGATGLVGSHVLEQALADSRISQIVAPVRHALPEHSKLFAPIVNFEQLPDDAMIWEVDAVICTLGSTMKVAGSKSAFRQVDYTYPLECAKLAKKWGCPTYALTSALGANANSPFFYSRIKGELERSLIALNFESLTLVRPNVISGHRNQERLGEVIVIRLISCLSRILPASCQISPAKNIASALLNSAIHSEKGVRIISSKQLA
ncbi:MULTISPECIES: NAD-dependent dehydratase [Providencia]|uniref:NAD-dependent dehydratase n=1 Tax=Providencia TaxID=586 RepID=UPI0019826BF7|nr:MULTISPECIES: NAD-dependent dehydratase [Providencia]MBN4863850.1 NAD-dependent dehydratase [Providencia stuartii]MBN4873172.1 NAD-dependent dehydratase [Providencia stuartii]MBN4877707.1 NAD-dependent dehydratase [Providencia stuartii]MBN4882373.1 NAD-dependent dehydratase [Providencia stuartii]